MGGRWPVAREWATNFAVIAAAVVALCAWCLVVCVTSCASVTGAPEECVSDMACDDSAPCTVDGCTDGRCANLPVNDGTPCEGGQCVNGECVDVDLCEGVECPVTGNECTVSQCNLQTGECEEMSLSNGTECNEGAGACINGECVDNSLCVGVACPSSNQCVEDGICDPSTGECFPGDKKPANTVCDMDFGNFCDGEGRCVECNDKSQCDDGDDCTDDNCDPMMFCRHDFIDVDSDMFSPYTCAVGGTFEGQGGDCLDSNPDMNPAQTAYFTTPGCDPPCISLPYDYNCNGRVDQQYVLFGAVPCGPSCSEGRWAASSVAGCGETAEWLQCVQMPMCVQQSGFQTQACK